MNNEEKIVKALDALQQGQARLEHGQQEQGKAITRLEQGQVRLEKYQQEQGEEIRGMNTQLSGLERDQAHTNTALDAVTAGIEDVQENMATREDVKRLESGQEEIKVKLQDTDAKYYKKVREHEHRIDELEKHEGLPNPTKH